MEYSLDNEKLAVIEAFFREWVKLSSPNSILYLKSSQLPIFPLLDVENSTSVSNTNEIGSELMFPIILGDLPLGMKPIQVEFKGKNYNIQSNWWEIFQSLLYLTEEGVGFFIIEPIGFSSKRGNIFKQMLQENGFDINAYFNTPEKILHPALSFAPVIVAISRQKTENFFVAELVDELQAQRVAKSFFEKEYGNNLLTGMLHGSPSFEGFKKLKIDQQFLQLSKQYESYSKQNLGELTKSFKLGSKDNDFEDLENCIYIPKIGNSPVVSNPQDLIIKQQNYYQIQLEDSVENAYVVAFLNSKLGKLSRETAISFTFIPHLNKSSIKFIPIFFPSSEEQQAIVNSIDMLARLKFSIDEFNEELSLNPKSAISIQEQLLPMLDIIDKLTDIDKVQALIREGETKTVEFKETLSFDTRKKTKERYLETMVLKTIVAFLNTDGGNLIVGVNDAGETVGIDKEMKKLYKYSNDEYYKKIRNLVKERIGEQFYPFIDYKILNVSGKKICLIDCQPSNQPCFLDQNDFYVRTNPSSDKLEGRKFYDYIQTRFPK